MRALALVAALAPDLALAQDLDQAREDCQEFAWTILTDLSGLELFAMVQATPDGWCEALRPSVTLPGPGRVNVAAEVLRWRSEGMLGYARALAEGRGDLPPPPDRLELEVRGAWTLVPTGDELLDWLLVTQSVPERMDGTLSLAAAGEAGLELRLDLDIPHGNAIRAKAMLDGVDLSSPASMQASLGGAALTRLSAQVTTRDLFETRVLPALAPMLMGDLTDPEEMVRRQRVLAQVQIGRLPTGIFPDPTQAELLELLGELPNPSGTLSLEVVAVQGGGLGLPRFSRFVMSGLPDTPEELWPALDGVTVSANWAPDQASD